MPKKHNKDSICPVIYQNPDQKTPHNSFSISQIPLFSETVVTLTVVQIRNESIRYHVL